MTLTEMTNNKKSPDVLFRNTLKCSMQMPFEYQGSTAICIESLND